MGRTAEHQSNCFKGWDQIKNNPFFYSDFLEGKKGLDSKKKGRLKNKIFDRNKQFLFEFVVFLLDFIRFYGGLFFFMCAFLIAKTPSPN